MTQLNNNPQIPAIFGQLDNSIQALTARLEAMQQRNPGNEFVYGLDNSPGRLLSDATFLKGDIKYYNPGGNVSQKDFSSSLDVRRVKFGFTGYSAAAAGLNISTSKAFRVQLANNPQFTNAEVFILMAVTRSTGYNQSLATGDITMFTEYTWDVEFPLARNYVRVDFGAFGTTEGNDPSSFFTPAVNAWASNFNYTRSPLMVAFYGK